MLVTSHIQFLCLGLIGSDWKRPWVKLKTFPSLMGAAPLHSHGLGLQPDEKLSKSTSTGFAFGISALEAWGRALRDACSWLPGLQQAKTISMLKILRSSVSKTPASCVVQYFTFLVRRKFFWFLVINAVLKSGDPDKIKSCPLPFGSPYSLRFQLLLESLY